jgi:molybdenum ABC transporter, periplasmic molybdate-binding protein
MNLMIKRKLSERLRKRHWAKLFFLTLLCLFCCSCKTSVETQSQPQEINVAAAANLTDAFTELGKEFTKRTSVRVVFSYGATADLARQIEQDAPFDVFASADVENVERLASKGLLASGGLKLYARGRLVIWTPPGARLTLTKIEDLSRAEIERIGIAKPDVAPYGRASVEALRALNLWPQLESKVVYGQNVSQVRQYAATGNVDAAFIPLALVRAGEGRTLEVDERLHKPINQAIAILKNSQKQEAARRFVEFVLSEEGQALLERYGYRKP